MPSGFGFFRELLRGEAVLATLPEVATDAVDPFPAPPTYGLPLASVIEIVPPATHRDFILIKLTTTLSFLMLLHYYQCDNRYMCDRYTRQCDILYYRYLMRTVIRI